jgi:MFS family permease
MPEIFTKTFLRKCENVDTMKLNLPQVKNKNIAIYYLLTAFNESWFIAGNWIFFWTRYMTYGQLGVVDAFAFAFGLIMEIPTGGVADILGKKKTIIFAMFLIFLGVIIISPASSLNPLFIGFLIVQLGWALYSGSAEALAFDTLVDNKQEKYFDEVISTSHMVGMVASVVGSLLGGLLFLINFRLPHFAWGFAMLAGFIVAFWLTEPESDTEKFSWKGYFKQLYYGAKHLFIPKLRRFVPVFFALQGGYFLYTYGFIKPAIAISFGFLDKAQAILFALFTLMSAYVVKLIPTIRSKVDDYRGLLVLTVALAAAFALASLPLGYYGLAVMLVVAVAGKLSSPWVSIVVNSKIESKYRATTLSTLAMINRIPYVGVAILAGRLIESGKLPMFNAGVAISILGALSVSFLYLQVNRKRKRISP